MTMTFLLFPLVSNALPQLSRSLIHTQNEQDVEFYWIRLLQQ